MEAIIMRYLEFGVEGFWALGFRATPITQLQSVS